MATLPDLEATWSLDDVLRAAAVLDMREAHEADAVERARKDAERKRR